MDRPFTVIDYKAGRLTGSIPQPIEVLEQMKLMMYDAHDLQAVQLLHWLRPTNLAYP